MAEQKIEFRKIRDFSENLNDTFLFIKQNFKPLVISFLTIAGVFILANSIFNGIYQSRMEGFFRQIFSGGRASAGYPYQMLGGSSILLPILGWLSMTAMQVTIIAYIKVYELKQREEATVAEVWEEFKAYYFKVLIYSIPVYLLSLLGYVFCIAPGVYFTVVFLPFPVLLMVENVSFNGAYNRCFEIIKNNWWQSFVIYLVVYLIYAFSAAIISYTMAGVAGLLSYFTTNDLSATIGIATSVLSVFSFVFYIIFYVSVAMHYFTLAEKLDGTGMLQRLDRLGEKGGDFDNIKEQY
ncbi:MAG: hypothetical protein JWQ40_1063 [Segetibacter sp.]|nr:hypothetical protein [Segetibacter sp.]